MLSAFASYAGWLCCLVRPDKLAGYVGWLCYVTDYALYAGWHAKLTVYVGYANWLAMLTMMALRPRYSLRVFWLD
jgi:hypothetical protein